MTTGRTTVKPDGFDIFRQPSGSSNLSCGIWGPDDDLERAQRRAVERVFESVGYGPHNRVLHIGNSGSVAPHVGDGVTHLSARDYPDFTPSALFDNVVSVQGLEQLVTPAERMRGKHIRVGEHFFRMVRTWTAPGAGFGLLTVTANCLPRRPESIRALAGIPRGLPLWSYCWRTEEIIKACGATWEVQSIDVHREDYAHTFLDLLSRLHEAEPRLRVDYGDSRFEECEGFLRTCAWAFEESYLSLAQFSLRRIDQ